MLTELIDPLLEEVNKIQIMAKGAIAAGILIFKAGAITGFLFGIGLAFDVPLDQIGAVNLVVETLCESNILDNNMMQYNCDELLLWIGIASVVLAIVSILVTVSVMGHWKFGLIIYGVSWGIGYYVSTLVIQPS